MDRTDIEISVFSRHEHSRPFTLEAQVGLRKMIVQFHAIIIAQSWRKTSGFQKRFGNIYVN
jgi:hypothetical protein